jgi:hypothetical protein
VKRLLVLALASCGSGHSAPAHPAPPPAQHEAQVAVAEAPPSAPECEQLLDHAIGLTGRQLTDEEHTKVRAQLHDELLLQCQAMPRATYTCAMAATTMPELSSCDQRTPSSSTSNSSVAPPGITPPAPRSP